MCIPIIDDEKIVGAVTAFQDITERKEAERELQLFMEAVEEAADGVQIMGSNGYILYSNRAVEEIYGFSPEEFKGKHVNELSADPEFADKVVLPALQETRRWSGEIIVKHKDGHTLPIWLTAAVVRDHVGAPIALVGIIRDITGDKRERELSDALNDERMNPEVAKRFNLRSVMEVPLVTREGVVGSLFFGCHSKKAAFGDAETDFANKLSTSVALALENSRLYAVERHIADTLQESILIMPERIDGVEFDYLYRSARKPPRSAAISTTSSRSSTVGRASTSGMSRGKVFRRRR